MWLERAAEGGWPKAEIMLSQALMAGWPPFAKDETEGERWLESAAAHGGFDAQCKLAIRLMEGVGVPKNPALAVKWWPWAAEHGCPEAQKSSRLGHRRHVLGHGRMGWSRRCRYTHK